MVSLRRIFSDFALFRREYLRNRTGFFFALIFPIILVLIFGAIFSGGSSGPVTAYVQNQDGGAISIAFMNAVNSTGAVQLTLIPNNVSMSQYLLTHSGSIGILIPPNFSSSFINGLPINITIYSNPSDTSAQVVTSVTNGVINAFNLKRADASAVIGMQLQTISSQPNYKYIDFLIPGLIGFSILTSPMFSMVNISSEYKKTKLFKQLSLTPLTKGEWLASKIMWYVTLSILSFILMSVVGIVGFGAHVTITAWIIPFLLLGPLFFVSLGMFVGSVTKSVESAGVVGNIITFPMMFLSGTFFPVSLMPSYLQNFAKVLPLYYLIDGLNSVMVYDNYSSALLDIVVLGALSAIVFVLAIRVFKWRED
ncbi:MAG: ABC transporter permease [Nitrososphaerota archaeon]|nr:ABC transporter permease [Nitrososphaerota archaeon]